MKKQKQIDNVEKVTVLFGYGLFALFLVALIQTTVYPWVTTLFYPAAKHLYILIFAASMIAGGVLPTLLSYFIGDRVTHSKNKLVHHFDGVLFGIAAFWIALFIGYFSTDVITWLRSIFPDTFVLIVNSAWQIAIPALIMAVTAYAYTHQRKRKSSILEFRPYQMVLFGSITLFGISVLVGAFDSSALFINVILTIGMPLFLTALSYVALLKLPLPQSSRLTLSVLSMSFAFIASYITSMSLSYVMAYNDFLLFSFITSPVVMVAYLLFIRRHA